MTTRNLLTETVTVFTQHGLTADQITYIGSLQTGHSCTWDEFVSLADIEYDAGFGGQEIADDLVILFADGSKMDRREYDGKEWWEVHQTVKPPAEADRKPIVRLKADIGWETLESLNEATQ